MKIFRYTPDNVSSHRRSTKGIEYIAEAKDQEDFYNQVAILEDQDFFPNEETGFAYCTSGAECYDPNYPNEFDFGDYKYFLEQDELDKERDWHYLKAIELDS